MRVRSSRLAPVIWLAFLSLAGFGPAFAESPTPNAEDFRNAASDVENWILPAKSYANNPLTPSTEITRGNIAKLRLAWRHSEKRGEITAPPLVWRGTMFVATSAGAVMALDAATGNAKWRVEEKAGGGWLALFDGHLFYATRGGDLLALDPASGHTQWEVAAAPGFVTAPIPYDNPATGVNMLVIGIGASAAGEAGGVGAFAARDGKQLWFWQAIPGPGSVGHESWGGESWRRGGVAPAGIGISPAAHTLFVTLGSPAPSYDGAQRPGDNFYSDSLVALDIIGTSPKLRGYHQFIGHDVWNWGMATAPMLLFGRVGEREHNLVVTGDRGGNLWVTDGDNGALLDHSALAFVKNGATRAAGGGAVICPAIDGGIQSFGGAFDPSTNTLFIANTDQCATVSLGKTGADVSVLGPGVTSFNAIALASGTFLWREHFARPHQRSGEGGVSASFAGMPRLGPPLDKAINAGALLTASGFVFTGGPDGVLTAFDAHTGQVVWHEVAGVEITTPAIAYRAGHGDMIAVGAGSEIAVFAEP